jgi:uncharacterized protein
MSDVSGPSEQQRVTRLTPTPPTAPSRRRWLLIETLAVLIVTVAPVALSRLAPALANPLNLAALVVPLAYLFIERWARHRPWSELGVRRDGFVADVRSNWQLFVLVVVVLQAIPVTLEYLFLPSALSHTSGRVPAFSNLAVLIPLILVLSLREELVFRSLFQERIAWFLGPVTSIVGVSVLFALTHFSAGPVAIVALDLLFVFFDSVVYGLIFWRSRNVFVAWAAHASADLVGLALLLAAARAV